MLGADTGTGVRGAAAYNFSLGVNLLPKLSLELGLIDPGNINIQTNYSYSNQGPYNAGSSNTIVDYKAYSLTTKYNLLIPQTGVLLRLGAGIAYAKTHYEVNFSPAMQNYSLANFKKTNYQWVPILSGEMLFSVHKSMQLIFSYTHIFGHHKSDEVTNISNNTPSIDLFGVGVKYDF
ncbi:hypothetical protein BGC07_15405 [Piscirickettsia litoralis]|uniref:Outer membrane protein beta-barrel domain-containing protein n=2 Tax=Piscirickettsia litoralis TaxID=1891921 RepID=A0ABX2ZZP3_9GAMM|nr:hypothetical protein BGC07_15405 [Piscirickettsia litoralis]